MLFVLVLQPRISIVPMQNIKKRGILMTYKTTVIDYSPKAKKMAAAIEKTANEKAQNRFLARLQPSTPAPSTNIFMDKSSLFFRI